MTEAFVYFVLSPSPRLAVSVRHTLAPDVT